MSLPEPALDRPLPEALTGHGHGWFTRYRRWPVFSPGWQRGRLLAALVPYAVLAVALLALLWRSEDVERPWAGIVHLLFNATFPLLAGPWLAGRVRRRGWAPARETVALWVVLLGVVAAQLAFDHWAAEPMKQRIAEWTGQVDAQGRRVRTALTLGLSLRRVDVPPDGRPTLGAPICGPGTEGSPGCPSADGTAPAEDEARLFSGISGAALSFFIAGGLGIGALRRERAGLAALAQQQALAQAQAQQREAELRLSVLAAQVEPHFLFNTLAGVRSAIATDPARASDMVDRLVTYLRAAIPRLRSDGGAAATLDGQVELVRAYLALMQARMPRMQYTIDVPEGLGACPFPPLMLISLAENAVKHGVEPKIGPAQVSLRAQRAADGQLAVSVDDDGVGFGGATAGTGLGLTNLRERLQQLFGGRAQLTLRERPGGGVSATITLPCPETAP